MRISNYIFQKHLKWTFYYAKQIFLPSTMINKWAIIPTQKTFFGRSCTPQRSNPLFWVNFGCLFIISIILKYYGLDPDPHRSETFAWIQNSENWPLDRIHNTDKNYENNNKQIIKNNNKWANCWPCFLSYSWDTSPARDHRLSWTFSQTKTELGGKIFKYTLSYVDFSRFCTLLPDLLTSCCTYLRGPWGWTVVPFPTLRGVVRVP